MERLKGLVIEDNLLVGQDIIECLRTNGFVAVGPATTIEDARVLYSSEKPDFVVCDIRLKVGTEGLTAMYFINKMAGGPVPVVFETGFGWVMPDNIRELFPCAALVRKPIFGGSLIDAVNQVLALKNDLPDSKRAASAS